MVAGTAESAETAASAGTAASALGDDEVSQRQCGWWSVPG